MLSSGPSRIQEAIAREYEIPDEEGEERSEPQLHIRHLLVDDVPQCFVSGKQDAANRSWVKYRVPVRNLDCNAIRLTGCPFFPGLWLDTAAVWTINLQQMNSVLQLGLATPEHAEFVAQLASRKH